MTDRLTAVDRRRFLAGAASLGAAAAAPRARAADVVATTPFARIERLAPGVWAVISSPVNPDGSFNPQTLCNGGLVAGEDRVVAIDGYFQPAGAAWLQAQAEKLAGRRVTDVVVTHFHADHTGGLAGFFDGGEGPQIIATETTRKLIIERLSAPNDIDGSPFAAPSIRPPVLPTQILSDEAKTLPFDIGGRTLTLDHKRGHTPSDLAVHVDDTVFAGDLVWADYFHNYVDAIPSDLRRSAGDLLKDRKRTIVTGHGRLDTARNLAPYLDLLDHVEEKARAAHGAGKSVEDGAADFSVPETLGPWTLFNPRYYETAFRAWYRELDG
ncbi:MAG: MBL fold metallo-hydrolase [Parvularculaceae bacterium]